MYLKCAIWENGKLSFFLKKKSPGNNAKTFEENVNNFFSCHLRRRQFLETLSTYAHEHMYTRVHMKMRKLFLYRSKKVITRE